jgi:hypothetical protein
MEHKARSAPTSPITKKIISETTKILKGKAKPGTCPDIWDGQTAERIVSILAKSARLTNNE